MTKVIRHDFTTETLQLGLVAPGPFKGAKCSLEEQAKRRQARLAKRWEDRLISRKGEIRALVARISRISASLARLAGGTFPSEEMMTSEMLVIILPHAEKIRVSRELVLAAWEAARAARDKVRASSEEAIRRVAMADASLGRIGSAVAYGATVEILSCQIEAFYRASIKAHGRITVRVAREAARAVEAVAVYCAEQRSQALRLGRERAEG